MWSVCVCLSVVLPLTSFRTSWLDEEGQALHGSSELLLER